MAQFVPSSVHKAIATFKNPKSAGFDYMASLCMGAGWTEMASASFHLDAGQSKAVEFQVTMPSAVGTYPVYFKVTSGGVLIGGFAAEEQVVLAIPSGLIILGVTAQRGADGSISVQIKWTAKGVNWGMYEGGPEDFFVAGAYFGDAASNTWGLYRENVGATVPCGAEVTSGLYFPWDFLTGMGEHPEEAYKYHDFKCQIVLRESWQRWKAYKEYIAVDII